MEAILTTAINFQNAQDVEAYKLFSAKALPDGDRRYSGVDAYRVGYENIILLDAGGYIIAKKARKNYRGFAINGEPVIIQGNGFKRIGCETDEEKLEELFTKDTDDSVEYRVAWIDFEGNQHFADFKDSAEADAEYEARLKTEKTAIIRRINN